MNKLCIRGVPIPQGRPRVSTKNKGKPVAYDPKKSRVAKQSLALSASMHMKIEHISKIEKDIPVMVKAEFVFPLPNSWSKAKKERMSGAYKTSKPDADNLLKLLMDAFSGVLWADDKQVCVFGGVIKRYARYNRNTDKQEDATTTFYWDELPLSIGD